MKKAIRTFIIFWGIVALFPLSYVVREYYIYWLYGVQDWKAYVTTWLDENLDGKYDPEEKPLGNICIWTGYQPESGLRDIDYLCGETYSRTDAQGKWEDNLHGSCEEYYVFTRAPEGLKATTNLASNGCDAKFGFISESEEISQRILSVEQFVQRKIILRWVTRIVFGLFIIAAGIVGTIWLQKNPKGKPS